MFDVFLGLAFYDQRTFAVEDLEVYIKDLYFQVCKHIEDTRGKNLVEYTDSSKRFIKVNTIHVATMDERLNSYFYQTATRFGTLLALKLYAVLDQKTAGDQVYLDKMVSYANSLDSTKKFTRYDMENLLDMYHQKTGKTFTKI